MYFTGAVWILSCDTKIPLQRNKAHKRRETLERAISSSTTSWSPERRVLLAKGATRACPSCSPLGKAYKPQFINQPYLKPSLVLPPRGREGETTASGCRGRGGGRGTAPPRKITNHQHQTSPLPLNAAPAAYHSCRARIPLRQRRNITPTPSEYHCNAPRCPLSPFEYFLS